jgi:hypothetical protein
VTRLGRLIDDGMSIDFKAEMPLDEGSGCLGVADVQ